MHDPRINLKDRWMAALLAWLIPGAGHFYQGRTFKGAIYSVCILGLFLTGWAMADWAAVQPPDVRQPLADKTLLLKYTAQLGVGLPSLSGLVQSRRFHSPSNDPARSIDDAIEAEFEGLFLPNGPHFPLDVDQVLREIRMGHQQPEGRWPLDDGVPAAGTIRLNPSEGANAARRITGDFTGTLGDEEVEIRLNSVVLEEPVRASPRRRVFALVRNPETGDSEGVLVASIPRSPLNFLAVPMSVREENLLHGRLGNQLEIWMVFTWIAGLMNMLAIWDAYDGPAYGYGDEEPEPTDESGEAAPEPVGQVAETPQAEVQSTGAAR